MKTIRQKSIITLIVLFVLSLCLALTIAPLSAKAEDSKVFQMENGAQLYLGGDAIRFIAKMDETTYKEIVTDDKAGNVSLKILVGPREIFDQVEDGKYMSIADDVVEFDIPDSKIYNVGDYFYANARLQNLNSDKLAVRQMGLDFSAIAVKVTKSIADEQEVLSYEYAKFADDDIANNTRSQYDMVNETVLGANVDLATVILAPESAYSKWYGSSNYPIVPKTDAQVEALDALIEAELVDANELKVVADCKYYNSERQSAGFSFYHTIDDKTHMCACGHDADYDALRQGEDANTVLFFGREVGAQQIAGIEGATAGAKVVGYNAEKQALELSITRANAGSTATNVKFDTKGYEFNDGDYLYAEALVVGANLSIRMPATGNNATYFVDGVWATILVPATSTYIQFLDKVDATMYIRNVKAIPASEVKDIASTDTAYSFSCYDFVGAKYATLNTNGTEATYSSIGGIATGAVAWSPNGAVYSQSSDVVPYYVDGAIRFYLRSDQTGKAGTGIGSVLRIALKLAQPVTFTNGAITVTARGADFTGKVYLRNSADSSATGQKDMMVSTDQSGVPAGYVRYVMSTTFNSTWASKSYDTIIFDVTPTTTSTYAQATISSIWFPNVVKTHVYGDGELVSEANCTQAAEYKFVCSVCGETTTKAVGDALGHTYTVENATEETLASTATCQAPAKYFKSCEDCGAVSTDDNDTFVVGDVVDHNYVDGKCEWCSESSEFDFAAARTGEDANTVLFFGREEGVQQISGIEGATGGAKVVGYNAEKQALELSITRANAGSTATNVKFDTKGYEFNDGDYLYAEALVVGSDIHIRMPAGGKNNGTLFVNGVWASILVPSTATYIQFASNVDATMYIRNVKAIPASEVKDIATTGSETTYTLSGYSFVGGNYATDNPANLGTTNYEATYSTIQGTKVGACAWSSNGAIYSQASDVLPYYVNGTIRFYVRNHTKNGMDSTQKIVLKTATGYKFASGVISVVARGVSVTNVTLKGSTSASYGGSRSMSVSADQSGVPEGYVRYTMDQGFNSSWASEVLDYFIFTVVPTGDYCQGTIIDIKLP